MKNLNKQRRIQVIALSTACIAGVLVKEGSMTAPVGMQFSFVISEGAEEVRIAYVGNEPAPDLFEEDQGTIVKGHYKDGFFEATELLAKYDESYMPAEVIDALKERGVYQGDAS